MSEENVRRRWEKLDAQQRAIAEEIVRRALELRAASDGELSLREAVNLAAAAIERRGTDRAKGTFHNIQGFQPAALVSGAVPDGE